MQTLLKVTETVETVVTITTDEQIAYRDAEIAKLQKKVEAMQTLTDDELCSLMANSVKGKLAKKIEKGEILQASYDWSEIKSMRRSSESLASFLTESGIEKSLHGSAERACKVATAVKEAMEAAKLPAEAVKTAACTAMGGLKTAWRPFVIAWLFPEADDADEAEPENTDLTV